MLSATTYDIIQKKASKVYWERVNVLLMRGDVAPYHQCFKKTNTCNCLICNTLWQLVYVAKCLALILF